MTEQVFARANNTVPSGLGQVRVTTKYELLNYLRSRRFFILLGIIAVISTAQTLFVGYYRPAAFMGSGLDFLSNFWGSTAPYVAILAVFFGADAISGEFQNKTGYYLIPNPAKRASIYFGKWIAAFVASSIALAVFVGASLGNFAYYFGAGVPVQFGESLGFAWIFLSAVLGSSFFFSSLFKSSSYSILVTAVLFLFAFNLIERLVLNLSQSEPWYLITYGSEIIGNVFTVPYAPNVVTTHFGAAAFTMFNASIPEGLAIVGIYFLETTVAGLLLFQRKEFN